MPSYTQLTIYWFFFIVYFHSYSYSVFGFFFYSQVYYGTLAFLNGCSIGNQYPGNNTNLNSIFLFMTWTRGLYTFFLVKWIAKIIFSSFCCCWIIESGHNKRSNIQIENTEHRKKKLEYKVCDWLDYLCCVQIQVENP